MNLILQAIKSLFRKLGADVRRAQATANNAQVTADSAQAKASEYEPFVVTTEWTSEGEKTSHTSAEIHAAYMAKKYVILEQKIPGSNSVYTTSLVQADPFQATFFFKVTGSTSNVEIGLTSISNNNVTHQFYTMPRQT